jgi:hypothetical protein
MANIFLPVVALTVAPDWRLGAHLNLGTIAVIHTETLMGTGQRWPFSSTYPGFCIRMLVEVMTEIGLEVKVLL